MATPPAPNNLRVTLHRLSASRGGDGVVHLWEVESGRLRQTLRPPGPYAGMEITGVTGISAAQRAALVALGAVERRA